MNSTVLNSFDQFRQCLLSYIYKAKALDLIGFYVNQAPTRGDN